MHYSDNPADVRVDFWKVSQNGHLKWAQTETVKWSEYKRPSESIYDAFHQSLMLHFKAHHLEKPRCVGMVATCLEPYYEHSHPISVIVKDYGKEKTC